LVANNADGRRESRAQPTPLGEEAGANGLDAQPRRDVSTPQGDNPTRFDWRVDLRDNTYKYERLVEPVGSAEQARGRDTPFRTTARLNLHTGQTNPKVVEGALAGGARRSGSTHSIWDQPTAPSPTTTSGIGQ